MQSTHETLPQLGAYTPDYYLIGHTWSIVAISAKAVQIEFGGRRVWVPQSAIRNTGEIELGQRCLHIRVWAYRRMMEQLS